MVMQINAMLKTAKGLTLDEAASPLVSTLVTDVLG
jgi:hypothetical protein